MKVKKNKKGWARYLTKIPFSYMYTLRKLMGKPKTILDLGCGNGNLMHAVFDGSWNITGIDIHENSLKKARKSGCYKKLIKGDLIRVCNNLIRNRKKYDLVFCSQVIEHITQKEGLKLLDAAEKLTDKRILFGTPRGYMVQPKEFLGNNPYQVHKSGWSENDFKKRGYRVYGVGFNPVWSERGLARGKKSVELLFWTVLSFLFSPLITYFPKYGAGIIAIKEK